MTKEEAKAAMDASAEAVREAVTLLLPHEPIMRQFLEEYRLMREHGMTLRPDLYNDTHHNLLAAAVHPLMKAALNLLEEHRKATQALVEELVRHFRVNPYDD